MSWKVPETVLSHLKSVLSIVDVIKVIHDRPRGAFHILLKCFYVHMFIIPGGDYLRWCFTSLKLDHCEN